MGVSDSEDSGTTIVESSDAHISVKEMCLISLSKNLIKLFRSITETSEE
jgi:hypothetical protein